MATYFRTDDWVKSALGPAVSGAHLYWCTQPATVPNSEQQGGPTPQAQLYADPAGLNPLSQPVITDGFGHADAYLAPGVYLLAVYNNGSLMASYPDQSIGVGGGLNSLNGLTGEASLAAGTGISLAVVGSSIIVSSSGASGVASLNTLSGALNIVAETGIGVAVSGSSIQITNSGVVSLNSLTGAVAITAGSGISISVVGSNVQVTNTSTGPTFSTSGQGGFIGPGYMLETALTGQLSQILLSGTANQITVWQFQLFATYVISKVTIRVVTGSAGATASFGIYNASGNKVLDSGAMGVGSSSTTVTVTLGSSVTLGPGTYYLASSSTSTNVYVEGFSPNSAVVTMTSLLNLNATRIAQAANSTSGGVMPATLGTLTGDGNYTGPPLIFFEV